MQALIVVHQPELRTALVSAAREFGFDSTTPENAPAALDAFRVLKHPLVVITCQAPQWDGTQLYRDLRQLDPNRLSTILVITSNVPSGSNFQLNFDPGADDFVIYPIDPALLRIRLQIAIRHMQNRAESIRIEQQLRESNERFELAVRGANEGLWDTSALGKLWNRPDAKIWYSPRFKQLLGYSDEEFPNILGSWSTRLHPEDRQRIFEAVTDHIEHKKPYDVQYRLRTKSGEYRWYSARGQGIWDAHDELLRMSGSLRDITNIKEYEAKLKERESTWRSLVENAPDIILTASLDGTIKFINRFTDIAKDSIGRSIYEYVEEPYRDRMRAALDAVRTTGELQRFEALGMSEHGKPGVWYANRLGPIWRGDQIENAILIATDITQRKHAEEQVRLEQQSLRRTLDIQERERRLVAYDIHDGLVQYLTGALMHLEAFAASAYAAPGDAPPDYDRGIELLREALAEGRRLVSGLRPPILDERGIVAALEYLVTEVRPEIPQIEFVNHTQFGRLTPAIEVAIFRITQEAITNVRLHSGAQRAQVELVQRGEWVRLVVRDWGLGFDPASVQEERFGLQGIRQRARLLGASAVVQSAPGQGTVLTVDFPLIQEKPMATGAHSPSAQK